MSGKLTIVGLGLAPDLITWRGLKAVEEADLVLMDEYTSRVANPEKLNQIIHRKVVGLRRKDLEENVFEKLLMPALEGRKIAVLVPGNPLIATTHIAVIVEAAKHGIAFDIIPAPGIIPNALTLSGLMIYKAGRPATVTYPVNGKLSTHPYEVVKENDKLNLHSPLLLEMDWEKKIMMKPQEAVEILFALERVRKEGVFPRTRKVVVVSALGGSDQRICVTNLGQVKDLSPNPGPHTLIITSPKLHFMEEEALKVMAHGSCM